ncbi:hypothetical protein [Devosia ginsengisoli]|uniref:Uncharacterized protein n=1 Tax=Devosia ginsengisoli TaxID=400770 RepID=A0A5B8LTZ8_9HYPH|nr:hypothetical protein [Devosia ginsengisoli]QDZ11164.1 hypothetical protein FPZ08_10580 [Devosia ginsengisoli]
MNQMSGRHACPDLRNRADPGSSFSSPQKRWFRRLFRLHFQSALNEKEPERTISVKRLVIAILTNFPASINYPLHYNDLPVRQRDIRKQY